MNKIYYLENHGHVNFNEIVFIGELTTSCDDCYFDFKYSYGNPSSGLQGDRIELEEIHKKFLEAWKEYHANT